MRIAEQFAEREAQLRREAAELAKIETREKKAKKPKKKALKGEVEKDSWAWRNGGAMEQGPRPVGLYYDEVDEALRRAVNRQSRDNIMWVVATFGRCSTRRARRPRRVADGQSHVDLLRVARPRNPDSPFHLQCHTRATTSRTKRTPNQ